MRSMLSKIEIRLLCACLGLAAFGLFGPAVAQPVHYHAFADQRVLWGVPFGMDVLSNLTFAVAGMVGACCLVMLPPRVLSNVQRAMAVLFFAGLVLTAAASGWYHWQPDDAGLTVDRCGMAVAFAGLLGLAVAGRVSERAGAALGLAMLVLGPLSVQAWSATGNVLPWAVMQFGGMGLILSLALLRPLPAALNIRWSLLIVAYVAAKLLEANDHLVYQATAQLVSGHTLKHVTAALAAWPVIAALRQLGNSGQNSAAVAAGTGSAIRRAGNA